MTSDEYLNEISKICEIIDRDPELSLRKLDALFAIKPVRQQWFICKAKAMFKLNYSNNEIYSFLSDVFGYETINQTTKMYFDFTGSMISEQYFVLKNRHYFLTSLYTYLTNSNPQTKYSVEIFYKNLSQAIEAFFHTSSINNLVSLLGYYYITENQYIYLILCLLAKRIDKESDVEIADWVRDLPNIGYLSEGLNNSDPHTFIIIASEDDTLDCRIVTTALSQLGHKVFLLISPVQCPVENDVNMQDTLSISMDNIEKLADDVTVIRPLEIIKQGKSFGDNLDYIISYITENLAPKNLATLLCSGCLFNKLETRPTMQKKLQRLSRYRSDYLEKKLEFGWVGNYLSYISRIYGFDVQEELSKSAECDFSIVIPARNSAAALKYTLLSCLNQRFKGNYEIVLSDNSTDGNTDVYDLYRELNDARIKYYKTPRNLALSKSFEFAFLKAKGNFIFSLGSDDAVLPWGLEVLSQVLTGIPNDEIMMWDRGFYAWPGFNGGQQNQFVIPRQYQKSDIKVERIDAQTLLAQVLCNPDDMYGLPMLYINSGFKRSYMHTLLRETGRLWDGVCQDIYIGIVNISIYKELAMIKYPLTIAGMTGASIGMLSNKSIKNNIELNEVLVDRKNTDYIGGYADSSIERLLPAYDTDRSSLYRSILRMIARGSLPSELINYIDWKKTFLFIAQQLSIDDVQIDRKLNLLRNSASRFNEDIARYVNEELCNKLIKPVKVSKIPINDSKTYKEGFTKEGGLILDASKFNVSNVYDAAKLFENLTGL